MRITNTAQITPTINAARWSTVLEREDVVPGVIVRPEEYPFFILKFTPLLKCRSGSSVNRDRLICVPRLAASLISRMPANYYSIVVHSNFASVKVDVLPPESTDLPTTNASSELQEKASTARTAQQRRWATSEKVGVACLTGCRGPRRA